MKNNPNRWGPPLGNFSHIIPFFSLTAFLNCIFPTVFYQRLWQSVFFQPVFFQSVFFQTKCFRAAFSKLYFPKLYVFKQYFPKLYFSELYFSIYIFPNCILSNCIIPNCIFVVYSALASSKLWEFIEAYCEEVWSTCSWYEPFSSLYN